MAKQCNKQDQGKIPANNFAAHPGFNSKDDAEFGAEIGLQNKQKQCCNKQK